MGVATWVRSRARVGQGLDGGRERPGQAPPARGEILCLHGYRQNGKTFRDRTGSLRKILKKHAELVYISAPNVIPAQREEEEAAGGDGDTHTDDQRAWWFTVDPARAAPGERLFDSTAASALSVGFDDSVLAIARTLTELGPFHGILGFSQGASMASLILAMQRDNDARFSFGFAVLVSGFRSSSTEHRGAYAGGAVPTPSLHVRGLTDRVIAHQRSAELQQGYSHASELVHPGATLTRTLRGGEGARRVAVSGSSRSRRVATRDVGSGERRGGDGGARVAQRRWYQLQSTPPPPQGASIAARHRRFSRGRGAQGVSGGSSWHDLRGSRDRWGIDNFNCSGSEMESNRCDL
ncbi:esterase OVCA2 isoform X2 [Lampetra planeri]